MNYEDNEKSRVDYVARLEATLTHATAELAKYRAIAEKWEPRCNAEVDSTRQLVSFTLSFGGKCSTAQATFSGLQGTDIATAVSAIIDSLVESNVSARLRDAVEPEVQRVMPNLKVVAGAGKW